MSLEGWKFGSDVAAVILLFLTFLAGAGAWYFGNRLGKAKDIQLRQFDKDLTDAKIDLGKQQVLVAEADERVAGLEKDVAIAKTDMAKQQARAAAAEQSLLELQTRLAHRRIGQAEHAKLVVALRPYEGSAVHLTKLGDAEAAQFADDVIAVFTDAKWKIALTTAGSVSPPVYGVRCLLDTSSAAGRALADVLAKLPTVRIQAVSIAKSPQQTIVGDITVGLKPPP